MIGFNILIAAITFFIMEGMAWFTHKYVMHGFMWQFHADHHIPRRGWFEKNDVFFLIFAVPSFLCFLFGAMAGFNFVFFIGLGILVYGFAYFMVHDVFIHQRFKWLKNANTLYFKAIRKAHKIHHKHVTKEHGECFGMLIVPIKYYREAYQSEKNRRGKG